jgi:hypothetical protein
MPLQKGKEWVYKVRTPYYTFVEPVTVVGETPVGANRGFELRSSMGGSRIGWDKGVLYASSLGQSQYLPPLPLLDSREEKASFKWKGILIAAGKSIPGTATIVQEAEELQIAARTLKTRRSTLNFSAEGTDIELVSWFATGYGLVRQEQRTNGALDVRMEWIRGPGNSNRNDDTRK